MTKTTRIYQLKITLRDVRPPVWRRVLVAENTTLPKLHRIFQIVMGWEDSHLHAFRIGDLSYGDPDAGFGDGWLKSERSKRLEHIAPEVGAKFIYEYDFGDSWDHQVLVEKILEAEPNAVYPLCVKGKRACPPEDCGGAGGYEDFLEALRDTSHEEHKDTLGWVGGAFDPEAFDQNAVNKTLRSL